VLYSALRLSNADAKLMNGSSRIFTDNARTADSFNPRNDVKYSTSFSSAFGADAWPVAWLDAAVDENPLTVLGVSAVFDGSTAVDFAPNAEVGPSDEPPNAPNVDTLGTAAGVDVAVEAGVSTFTAGALKLNPAKGVLLALDVSLVDGFEVLVVLPNKEAGAAVLTVDVDADVVVAALVPKLKPEKGLLAGTVLVEGVDVAGAPNAKGALVAGGAAPNAEGVVAEGGAAAGDPKEKPDKPDETGAPKLEGAADALGCPDPKDGVDVDAVPWSKNGQYNL
jgi:hypothetical protein